MKMVRSSNMSVALKMGWVLMMGMTVISIADGQSVPLCADKLSPCIDYINSTNPPNTCCNPIKEIDTTQQTCFCKLGLTPGILEGLGITTTQAVQLLHSCGVNFSITTCKASSSALPPSSVQPPAMPGDDNGGAGRVTITGISFLLLLFLYVLFI